MWIGHCKEIQKLTFQVLVVANPIWWRGNAQNANNYFWISLQWAIHIPVDKTKSVSQGVSESVSESVSQAISQFQSVRESVSQSVSQSGSQAISQFQSVRQSGRKSVSQWTHQWTCQQTNQSINQSINLQCIYEPTYLLVNQSGSQCICLSGCTIFCVIFALCSHRFKPTFFSLIVSYNRKKLKKSQCTPLFMNAYTMRGKQKMHKFLCTRCLHLSILKVIKKYVLLIYFDCPRYFDATMSIVFKYTNVVPSQIEKTGVILHPYVSIKATSQQLSSFCREVSLYLNHIPYNGYYSNCRISSFSFPSTSECTL